MEPDSFLDFAFGGGFLLNLELFDRLVHEGEMHRSVHYDIFYHLTPDNFFKKLHNITYRFYFFIIFDRRPYINRIIDENIETLDGFNFDNLMWRGALWNHKDRYISTTEFNQKLKKSYTISRHRDVIPGIDYFLLPFRLFKKCIRVCFSLKKF